MAFHHVRPHKRSLIGVHPILDKIVYVSGIVSLLMMFPQLKLIYGEKISQGIEPITWFTLAVLDIPWIIYGLIHRERPLVFIYTGWLVVNILIFIGAIIY